MHAQEKWDGSSFEDQRCVMMPHCTSAGEVAAVGRATQRIMSETVDLQALQQYSVHQHDRRQDLLDQYIARHLESGMQNDGLSTIQIAYYKLPHYGRLMARGAALQKLTREARKVATSTVSAEIDASCCHPRLLVQKLKSWGLWGEKKYSMLNLFVDHYVAWRQCISDYADVSTDDAKIEFIRMGRPSRTLSLGSSQMKCNELHRACSDTSWQFNGKICIRTAATQNLVGCQRYSFMMRLRCSPSSMNRWGTTCRRSCSTAGMYNVSSALVESRLRDTCRQCFEKFILISIRSWPALIRDEPALRCLAVSYV